VKESQGSPDTLYQTSNNSKKQHWRTTHVTYKEFTNSLFKQKALHQIGSFADYPTHL